MLILLFTLVQLSTVTIEEVVADFHELKTKESEVKFINKFETSLKPSTLAYVIAIKMKQVDYTFNPLAKLKIFKTNKNHLNNLIDENPNNLHLRYIRLLLQENTPSFLGYKNYLEEDKLFLKQEMILGEDYNYLFFYILKNTSL